MVGAVQAHPPCYWAGAESPCLKWKMLAVLAAALAALDMCLCVALTVFGGLRAHSDLSTRSRRCATCCCDSTALKQKHGHLGRRYMGCRSKQYNL